MSNKHVYFLTTTIVFRESSTARTFLRASVSAGLAFLGALQLAMVDGITSQEWVGVAIATVGVLGGYLGIGAASGSMEPFFVNKLERVEVPSPPAVKEQP